jgi:glycosyltransferase involved in cell wall biosynthesis
MKLLVLDQFSELGGAQQWLLDLLPAIRERGWEALVAVPGHGELFGRVRAQGFAVERIECGPYRSRRKSPTDMLRFLRDTPRLARHIREMAADADLVYIIGPRLLPAAAMAGLTAPAVFHAHSYIGPGLLRRFLGSALRRLRAPVIGNCEFVAAPWREYSPEASVIYNGVRASAAPRRADGPGAVVCIGRIAPEKGQLEFLDAAGAILGEAPESRFIVYGAPLFSGNGYAREVEAHAAGLPVEFAGWTDDVDAALAGAAILLAPSTGQEATTRVILEAYAAGVPVVAFANGGIPEVVEHGRSGFLARTVEEMARYSVTLLRDREQWAALADGARECWERRFTLERHRRDVVSALERAQRQAGQAPRRQPVRVRNRIA